MPEDVFLELVRKHQAQIYQHAFYMLNDREDATDVAQEVFIKAWKQGGKLRVETIKSWLLKCAHNLSLDLLRRRRFQLPLAKADDTEIETLIHGGKENVAFQAPALSPEELCMKQERKQLVQQAIARLPLHFRTVVVMREIEGLSFEEIAETLHQPVGTVKSNTFRARKKLREMLGNFFRR